ncbi:helix-turn-helix domain-containing protein [Spirosoma aureum]|uniref:hypothetical protein n=1 Tax=Spirosoma aureum TaxID=2692134 RepID=UPI001E446AD6|nr:hypothetical protein [Spirosoma aureum]
MNEHRGGSSKMCVRLSEAFCTSSEFWLNVQRNYDLWYAERTVEFKTVQHFGRCQLVACSPLNLKKY